MAAGKGARADGVEAVPFKACAELGKGIIKAAVAERHDRHSQRAVSVKAGLHKLEQLIWKLARVGWHTEYDKVARGKLIRFLARGGQREIAHLERHVEADGKRVGKRGGHFSRVAGGAEIDCINLRNVHGNRPSFFIVRGAARPYREKSSDVYLSFSVAGRGGTRLSGS